MALMIALGRYSVVCSLLTVLGLPAAALRADTFSALAFDNATVQPGGPRGGTNGKVFFNTEGANNTQFASYAVADFNSSDLMISGTPTGINAVTITLTQANAAFTNSGSLNFYLAEDTTTSIQPADMKVIYDATDPEGLNGQLAPVHFLGSGMFTQSDNGTQDTYSFVPDCTTAPYLLGVLNNGGAFRLVITPPDPAVAATYAGFSNPNPTLPGPTLTLDVSF
jgi:hypothetical protein